MKHLITIKQHDSKDCGAACLCSISRYYGKKHSLRFLRMLTHTGQDGVSFQGIAEAAERIGLNTEAYEATMNELLTYIKTEKKPVIVHLKSNHFVIAYKVRKNKLCISDPASGKYGLSVEQFQQRWSGFFMSFFDLGSDKDIEETTQKMSFITNIIRPNCKILFGIFVMSFVLLGISICSSYVYQILLDYGKNTRDALLNKDSNVIVGILSSISSNSVMQLFVFMVFLSIITMLVMLIKGKAEIVMTKKMDIIFMDNYISKIFQSRYSEISTRMTGDYITRMSDLGTVREMISGMLIAFLIDINLFILGSILLIRINTWLYAISLTTLLLYSLLILILRKPFEIIAHSVMSANAELQTSFKESIQGIELIKVNHIEENAHARLMGKYKNLKEKSVKGSMLGLYGSSVSMFINQISGLIILFSGFEFVNRQIMTIGELMTFLSLLSLFEGSANELVSMQQQFQNGLVSIDRLKDIDYYEKEIDGEVELQHINEIRVDRVGFSYFNRPALFENISFSISGNKKIAIVGENGSGKSTLLRIVMGMERALSGQVLINGMNIDKIKLHDISDRISFVTQTPFLFADTLLYNITLGNEYPVQEVMEVCNIVGLDEFLEKSPQGLETFIDENATNISAGQKQSISIARALIRKPDMIILDEGTCNMDAQKEENIIDYLLETEMPCNDSIIKKVNHVLRLGE